MPLHLLGKKSWNVYNADNIARVRRDEAAAAAKEAAEEQRMQEEDAKQRIQRLRGEPVTTSPTDQPSSPTRTASNEREPVARHDRKRRRLQGEDDTDRDIRYAREDHEAAEKAAKRAHASNAPIVDRHGHIALFAPSREQTKNPEAEAEQAKKTKESEDQYTMRFTNAAGFKQAAADKPWYSTGSTTTAASPPDRVSRNVWGNEDPRRKGREQVRMAASDPLLAIQQGVQGVRRADRAKKEWRAQRDREVEHLIREERGTVRRDQRKERRHRDRDESRDVPRHGHRRSRGSSGSLEGFSLDASTDPTPKRDDRHHYRHHRHEETPREDRRERKRSDGSTRPRSGPKPS